MHKQIQTTSQKHTKTIHTKHTQTSQQNTQKNE